MEAGAPDTITVKNHSPKVKRVKKRKNVRILCDHATYTSVLIPSTSTRHTINIHSQQNDNVWREKQILTPTAKSYGHTETHYAKLPNSCGFSTKCLLCSFISIAALCAAGAAYIILNSSSTFPELSNHNESESIGLFSGTLKMNPESGSGVTTTANAVASTTATISTVTYPSQHSVSVLPRPRHESAYHRLKAMQPVKCGLLAPLVTNQLIKGRFVGNELSKNSSERMRGRIVGGHTSSIEKHPWQVHLIASELTCGGSIIMPRWVLSTAHCYQKYKQGFQWTVFAGISSTRKIPSYVQKVKGKLLFIHRDFTIVTYNKDIALLYLERDMKFGHSVRSICLPNPFQALKIGQVCEVAGWGRIREGGDIATIIRSIEVSILDKSICNRRTWLQNMVNDVMICAGTADGSRDACEGDSGAPLTCYDLHRKHFYIAGMVSWGVGCARERMPGVYTDIAKLLKWIENQISQGD